MQRGGFGSEQDARESLERALERVRRANGTGTTLTLAGLVDEYLAQHDAQPETIEKLRWLLSKAVGEFGSQRLGQLRSQEIAAWRMTIPAGHRFEATQALRQVLSRAVDWQMIDVNPAKQGVDNPQRRRTEKRPFESWAQLAKVASRLGERESALVMFAAATGLRPGEWTALEQRDIDRHARVLYGGALSAKAGSNAPRLKAASAPCRSRQSRSTRSSSSRPGLIVTFCFRHCAALTSISTTSAPESGSPPSSQPGSHPSAASTIFGTRSRPSPCVPVSRPSTSPATWVPA